MLQLTVVLLAACASRSEIRPEPDDAAGVWHGEARTGTATLPLTIVIDRQPAGWPGTVDVPSQYALHYPLTNLLVDSVTLARGATRGERGGRHDLVGSQTAVTERAGS